MRMAEEKSHAMHQMNLHFRASLENASLQTPDSPVSTVQGPPELVNVGRTPSLPPQNPKLPLSLSLQMKVFKWSDGSPKKYTAWADLEPSYSFLDKVCAHLVYYKGEKKVRPYGATKRGGLEGVQAGWRGRHLEALLTLFSRLEISCYTFLF